MTECCTAVHDTELAWLAGLLDGEGCLSVRFVPGSVDDSHLGRFECRLEIDTVSSHMVDAVCSIADRLQIHYIREKPGLRPKSTRPATKFRVGRKRCVRRVVRAVLPYLVVKRPEALRLLEYLEPACRVSFYSLQPQDLSLPSDLKALKRIA